MINMPRCDYCLGEEADEQLYAFIRETEYGDKRMKLCKNCKIYLKGYVKLVFK